VKDLSANGRHLQYQNYSNIIFLCQYCHLQYQNHGNMITTVIVPVRHPAFMECKWLSEMLSNIEDLIVDQMEIETDQKFWYRPSVSDVTDYINDLWYG